MAVSSIKKPSIYFISPFNQQDGTIETLVNNIISQMTVDGLYIAGDTWKNHSHGYHAECIRKGYRLSGIIYEYANNNVYTFTTREDSSATIKIKTLGGVHKFCTPRQALGCVA